MYNQTVCLCVFNASLCSVCVFVTHSMYNNVCDGTAFRLLLYVYERDDKQCNSNRIRCFAFVSVTPIYLAWERTLYLFCYSPVSSTLFWSLVEVFVCGTIIRESGTCSCCLHTINSLQIFKTTYPPKA